MSRQPPSPIRTGSPTGKRSRRLPAASALLLLSLGCTDLRAQVRAQELQLQTVEAELAATRAGLEASRAWTQALATSGQSAAPLTVLLSPAQLSELAGRTLPYRLPAALFHRQLTGEIVVDGIRDIRPQPGNRLTCILELHGENVRFTGKVPKSYQREVQRFQAGLAAGVQSELDVQLHLEDGKVLARAQARTARLKAHGSAQFENMLRTQMNERALRLPLPIDVGLEGGGVAPRWLVLTQHHLVLGYAP